MGNLSSNMSKKKEALSLSQYKAESELELQHKSIKEQSSGDPTENSTAPVLEPLCHLLKWVSTKHGSHSHVQVSWSRENEDLYFLCLHVTQVLSHQKPEKYLSEEIKG